MVKEFPNSIEVDENIVSEFNLIIEAIVAIRRAKAIVDMGNQKIAKAYVKFNLKMQISNAKDFICKLAKVESVEFIDTKIEKSVTDVSDNLEVFIPLENIDLNPIIARLTKQKEKIEKETNKLNGMLSNERFVANAPQSVVVENRKALEDGKSKLVKIEEELKSLSSIMD